MLYVSGIGQSLRKSCCDGEGRIRRCSTGSCVCAAFTWRKSGRSLFQLVAFPLTSAGTKPYPQANTADSLAVYFTSQSPPTRVCWPDPPHCGGQNGFNWSPSFQLSLSPDSFDRHTVMSQIFTPALIVVLGS